MMQRGQSARSRLRFHQDQSGGATVLSLFGCIVLLLLSGLAIDSINAWRNRDQMLVAADAATHAGAAAIARGLPSDQVIEIVQAAASQNMNDISASYGRTGAVVPEILLAHYDHQTNRVIEIGPTNAILVTLRRNRSLGNAVPTFLLQMVGISGWDVVVQSVAVFDRTTRCDPNAGVFAGGEIALRKSSTIASGVCIHSQTGLYLPEPNNFEPGSWVSLPDLAGCGADCDQMRNAGIRLVETNVVMSVADWEIQSLSEEFTDMTADGYRRSRFFASRALSSDLSALDEVGVDIRNLKTGDVISLSPLQATQIRELPAGLIYQVTCGENGLGQWAELNIRGPGNAAAISNAALVTDCAIRFGPQADIRGSLIISTRQDDDPTVSAAPGAKVGDPGNGCAPGSRSWVLARSDMVLTADLASSNATFSSSADITIQSPPGQQLLSRGLGLHAGNRVEIEGQIRIEPCPAEEAGFAPGLKTIRHVQPG